jgi:hypothetical protein
VADGRLSLSLNRGERIALHGHTQKSMGLLARPPCCRGSGATVIDIDAGCAAWPALWYAREHYDVSVNRRAPAAAGGARSTPLGARAAGVSCRHQVEDFAAARRCSRRLLRSLHGSRKIWPSSPSPSSRRIIVSCDDLNVGVLSIARPGSSVYIAMPIVTVIAGFPPRCS